MYVCVYICIYTHIRIYIQYYIMYIFVYKCGLMHSSKMVIIIIINFIITIIIIYNYFTYLSLSAEEYSAVYFMFLVKCNVISLTLYYVFH